MRRFWRSNGLSVVLLALFVVTLVGQTFAGWRHDNEERRAHGRAEQPLAAYVAGPGFLEATMENWESEFLQMACYVVLTAALFQKGSAESKDPDGDDEPTDREPDPTRAGAPGPVRKGGLALALYKHSLSLTFGALFLATAALHAVGGAGEYNAEQAEHGEPGRVTALQYLGTSRFWFESLQNWQSEFLSLAGMVLLSIWLREHGSPESKPVDAAHAETGSH
ncbi:DUF6766 family protein [Roseisolibacter sp. H3M3-2]|uniref:DUF6766 family protein n=1 Tax=Roseisolibacter sp. H3M3-2 TaxID=3031323 RepID=UPI0023DCE689|nr:DUF6766 family protein [Roseisolibacter sp. H3M3-2]MDF1502405.1 hypothetical protein [Roseisolibacter sp. H3M3-2]